MSDGRAKVTYVVESDDLTVHLLVGETRIGKRIDDLVNELLKNGHSAEGIRIRVELNP